MRRGICQSHKLTARCGRLKNDLQLISVVSDDWLPTYRVCGRQTKRSENLPISRLSSLRAPTERKLFKLDDCEVSGTTLFCSGFPVYQTRKPT